MRIGVLTPLRGHLLCPSRSHGSRRGLMSAAAPRLSEKAHPIAQTSVVRRDRYIADHHHNSTEAHLSKQLHRRTNRIVGIALAAAFLAAAFRLTVARAGGDSKKINVGVQLYS